jgi:hypothetical protein
MNTPKLLHSSLLLTSFASLCLASAAFGQAVTPETGSNISAPNGPRLFSAPPEQTARQTARPLSSSPLFDDQQNATFPRTNGLLSNEPFGTASGATSIDRQQAGSAGISIFTQPDPSAGTGSILDRNSTTGIDSFNSGTGLESLPAQ